MMRILLVTLRNLLCMAREAVAFGFDCQRVYEALSRRFTEDLSRDKAH